MATEKNKLYQFNTGRPYSKNKQPIFWMLVDAPKGAEVLADPFFIRLWVLFMDEGRGIPGVIPVLVGNYTDLVNDKWVLTQYDSYQYSGGFYHIKQLTDAMEESRR